MIGMVLLGVIVALICFNVFAWRIAEWLIDRALRRPPDFTISPTGVPYLKRWFVIPRNRLFNVYLHQTLGDDDARALHDHPWWNCSIILRGAYFEIVPVEPRGYQGGDLLKPVRRQAGDVVFRKASAPHRLVLPGPVPTGCWSLFITGPRIRDWGFWCPKGKGWVHENVYRSTSSNGSKIGRGCE